MAVVADGLESCKCCGLKTANCDVSWNLESSSLANHPHGRRIVVNVHTSDAPEQNGECDGDIPCVRGLG
ncbi:hypothetical protein PI126_g16018 [Phytophthora idaei]|nr:hypothetical protein PI126_g16018 [Phytophthora idaei]